MLCSLELNWLKKFDKSLSIPRIAFVTDFEEASGMYFEPEDAEELINGIYYPLDKGLLIVRTDLPDSKAPIDTLAHEWRHHWQRYNFGTTYYDGYPWNASIAYDDALIEYYTKSYCEYDALTFANKVYPCDIGDRTKELVTKYFENKRNNK